MRSILCVLIFAGVAQAAPRCRLEGKPWLEGRVVASGRFARAVDARLGQEVEVFVAAPGRLDGARVVFGDAPMRGRTPWPSECAPQVAWRRVEPRMEHTNTPSPNAEAKVYANAV